jgi:hypothetical protein
VTLKGRIVARVRAMNGPRKRSEAPSTVFLFQMERKRKSGLIDRIYGNGLSALICLCDPH